MVRFATLKLETASSRNWSPAECGIGAHFCGSAFSEQIGCAQECGLRSPPTRGCELLHVSVVAPHATSLPPSSKIALLGHELAQALVDLEWPSQGEGRVRNPPSSPPTIAKRLYNH